MTTHTPLTPLYDLQGGSSVIYEGPAVVRSRSIQFPAECRVTFDWYVGTRVRVYADDAPALPLFDDRLEFEIPDVTFLAEPIALTVESSPGRSPAFDAVLTVSHAFRGGIDAPITKLIIHVCNLPPGFLEEEDWLRLDMSTGEWKIAIHETQGSAGKYENVRVNGGAAVTHLLTLEPARAGSFLHEDVAELQDALRHLMSFAFGRRIAFLLPVGIDSAGDQVFEIWGDPRRHTHTSGTPWYSPHRSTSLRHLWAGLLGRWADPRSRATLKVAIDLYTDAHHGPPLESRLVLAYAGLDMLAWHWLRGDRPFPSGAEKAEGGRASSGDAPRNGSLNTDPRGSGNVGSRVRRVRRSEDPQYSSQPVRPRQDARTYLDNASTCQTRCMAFGALVFRVDPLSLVRVHGLLSQPGKASRQMGNGDRSASLA